MRFIVELYRMIVLGALALALIAMSYVFFEVAQSDQLPTGTSLIILLVGLAFGVVFILSLGLTATFISMHDRLEDIADNARDLRVSVKEHGEGQRHG